MPSLHRRSRPGPSAFACAGALGVAAGSRTFCPPAAFALSGRIGGRARTAILVAAAGELVVDKLPVAHARTEIPGAAGRIVAAGLAGRALCGPRGAVLGAVVAAAATQALYRARIALSDRLPVPDAVVAVAEDAASYGLAVTAARRL